MNKSINTWLEFLIFVAFLIPIVVNDIRNHRIPDILIYTCFGIIILIRILFKYNLSYRILLNPAIGFFFIGILWFKTNGKIGLGDAKLSGLMALILGIAKWLLAMFFAALTGILFGLFQIWAAKIKKDKILPFAPFLTGGSIFSFFLGDYILRTIYGINF